MRQFCIDGYIFKNTTNSENNEPEYYTEKIVYNWLKEEFKNKKIISQAKFEWCKNKKGNYLPYDIYIEEENLIIEIDGPQHFKQIKDWKNPSDTFATDIYKIKKAINNNIRIIRILQEDIYYNKIKWKEILMEKIINNKNEKIIFIDTNNTYINYKKAI